MNQIERHSRASSDFSIERILAKDNKKNTLKITTNSEIFSRSEETFDNINIMNNASFKISRIIEKSTEISMSSRDNNIKINKNEELTWLQCTRYRPPKVLRKSVNGKSCKRRPGTHPRIPFTSSQLQILEDKYRVNAYLSRRDVIHLSSILRLPQSRVKIWFQNRRARDRRETGISGSNITILSGDAPSAYKSQEIPCDNPSAPNPV